jgi:xanthine permease XanP
VTSAPQQSERPAGLIYSVNESPPPLRLAMLGFQYAVMSAIYLILRVIIVRHAHMTEGMAVGLMGIACVGLAIGTALQSLPRGPIGSGFLARPCSPQSFLLLPLWPHQLEACPWFSV